MKKIANKLIKATTTSSTTALKTTKSTVVSGCGTCTPDFTPIVDEKKETQCFKYISVHQVSNAKSQCENTGHKLPRPESRAIFDGIVSLMKQHPSQYATESFPIDLKFDDAKGQTDLKGQKLLSMEYTLDGRLSRWQATGEHKNEEHFIIHLPKYKTLDSVKGSTQTSVVCQEICKSG